MKKALLFILSAVAVTSTGQAAIISSGLRDFVITNTIDGIYLDVDGGTLVADTSPDWDINAYVGGEALANNPSFRLVTGSITLDSPALNLTAGQIVSSASIFGSVHPGGFSGSTTHIGAGVDQFDSGSEGYLGFRLTTNGGAGPYYGWMRVALENDGSTGLIRDWAYENTGSAITVGVIPEPSTCGLLALGLTGLLRRKR